MVKYTKTDAGRDFFSHFLRRLLQIGAKSDIINLIFIIKE